MFQSIGGFRGGAEGAAAPPFFLYFQIVLRFCFEKSFVKCSFILSSETLTLLYFASRIRSQCCMLHVLKSEVFIRVERWGGGLGPFFLNFLDPPLQSIFSFSIFRIQRSVQLNSYCACRFEIPTKQNLDQGTNFLKRHDLHQKSPILIYSTISLILLKGPAAAKLQPLFLRVCLDLVFQVSSPSSACLDSLQASFLLAGVETLNHV